MRCRHLGAFVVLAGLAAGARADITNPAFRIQATNSFGTGELVIPSNWGNWINGTWHWETTTGMPILNSVGGGTLAMLDTLSITYQNDPVVNLNFLVTAGAAPTHFIISSALLSFPAISPATGNASAGVTVTDADQAGGALLTGNYAGGRAYLAQYNGFVPGGTTFTTLVTGPIAAPLGGTNVGSGFIGPTPIGPAVSDMSAQWDFNLSANDSASGTSSYNIVPAPATGALLSVGLLAVRRRRR